MTALHETPTIVAQPVAGHIGADISGVDIAGPLAPETVQQLKNALHATSHLAPTDIEHLDVPRTLHRVTVIGEVPAGPDGRESELVAGQPFTDKHVVVVDD